MTEKLITLLQPVYGCPTSSLRALETFIQKELGELDADIDVRICEKRFVLNVSGEDSEVAANFFLNEFGRFLTLEEVCEGEVYKGYISKINGSGIYVSCGPDFLISSESLKNLGTGTYDRVAERFGIIPYQPVSFVVHPGKKTAAFSKEQVDMWWSWKKSATDRLIINNATRSRVKNALKKKGHGRDVYGVERLGICESVVICKEKTDAPGLVASIGPLLRSDIGVIIGDKKGH